MRNKLFEVVNLRPDYQVIEQFQARLLNPQEIASFVLLGTLYLTSCEPAIGLKINR